jgi:hypothetical protein
MYHVHYVCKTVSHNLVIMRNLKHYFSPLLCAFFIFPLSIHIYCIVVAFGLEHFLLLFCRVRVLTKQRCSAVRWPITPGFGTKRLWACKDTASFRITGVVYTSIHFYDSKSINLPCFDSLADLRSSVHDYDTRSSVEINIPLDVSARSMFSLHHRGIRS